MIALAGLALLRPLRRRSYTTYVRLLLLLSLVVPFGQTLLLGGLVQSGAVILWSVLAPLGAVVIMRPRAGHGWFAAYLAAVLALLLIPPDWLPAPNRPLPELLTQLALNQVAISAITVIGVRYFAEQRDRAVGLLRAEEAKSEALLLNILPRDIAAILRDEHRTIADHFDEATILFADIVNFTPLWAIVSPAEAVELLNEIFRTFDALVDRYGLEKIKTVGDGYMVAGGVPRPRPDHASAVARLALDMLAYFRGRPQDPRVPLDIRIGIASGPVVAGVIGTRKFLYDLWGDTVNTASRMETHGVPGRIQISRSTYVRLASDFVCRRRGLVEIKGKGLMQTWYLVGERDEHRRAALRAGEEAAPGERVEAEATAS